MYSQFMMHGQKNIKLVYPTSVPSFHHHSVFHVASLPRLLPS